MIVSLGSKSQDVICFLSTFQHQQVPAGSGFTLQRWLMGSGGVCSAVVVSEGPRHCHLHPSRGNGLKQQEELQEVTEVTSGLISILKLPIGGARIVFPGLCCPETSSPSLIRMEVCRCKNLEVQVNCEKKVPQRGLSPIQNQLRKQEIENHLVLVSLHGRHRPRESSTRQN